MKFLFKTQFSFTDYGNFNEILSFLLKTLLIFLCALFPLFIGFFKYYKAHIDKEPEEDYYEALQEHDDFDEIETPFSSLSFRFQTYEEFLRTTENFNSNENDFVEENFSNCSNPDPDFELHNREDPENSSPNDLNFIDDIGIVDSSIADDDDDDDDIDEIDDPVESITESFEYDDFIKELQIEIMKANAKAKFESVLPSIPEESEYPIANLEDLKPWKKERSFNHKGIKTELHKFHKLYTEKMQKYDTLNHQITYTKELKMMQSKGLVESVSWKGLCGCKPEKKGDAETGELELVYVVQLWVSWEFIVWQYKKTLEICGRYGYGSCRFNEVAEKFQHFKVMIHRFMENEAFDQGSRVECYARTRLARRKLLQVPLLKEDDDNNEKDAVKIDRLIEIMQESIRILWQFIRADKLAHISTLKCHTEAEQECTSPGRSKIQKQILLQKERKIKKIIKRRNCTLKNCKDTLEEDDPDDELYFLAMVDLKLVSRVLNMQRITTDQLNWCHHKLNCISFPNGKIKTEHSSVFFQSS